MFRTLRHLLLPVLNALGALLVMLSLTMFVPLGIAYRDNEATMLGFAISIAITAGAGLALFFMTRRKKRELEARDGFLLVTLSWLAVALFSSIPFYLLLPNISYNNLFFESVSCLTTTGASALNNLDELPLSINYWRCLLSWLGGMGILVLAVAILPLLGVGGSQVFKAENTNLFKDSKLTPRIADTAKALYSIYVFFSLLCVLAYHWAGMNWDEAFMFMFTTMSLSGISPYDASIGHFNSSAIEMVAVLFIIFSGFNFSLHFMAWRQRSILSYFVDSEARAWLLILIFGTALVCGILMLNNTYLTWEETLRHALFSVASIFSTTGYVSADFAAWPPVIGAFLLFCGLFASCSGSTGGGVKLIRVLILIKHGFLTLEKLIRPRAYLPLRLGNQNITDSLVLNIFSFLSLHLLVVSICTFIILTTGVDFVTAFSSVWACIGNIGPGLGEVGPMNNYAWCNPVHLWVGAFCMFVGRLELFTVFVIFSRSFWRT